MATLEHPPGFFADQWCRLYEQLSSSKDFPSKLTLDDASFIDFIRLLYCTDGSYMPQIEIAPTKAEGLAEERYHRLNLLTQGTLTGELFLAYSGGKDSFAAAIELKRRGFDVTNVFVQGINQTLIDEKDAVPLQSKMMGLPYEVVPVKFKGKKFRPGTAMVRTLVILALLLDHGLRRKVKVAHYGVGVVASEEQEDKNTKYNFSDGPLALQLGCETFTKHVLGFMLHRDAIVDETDSYRIVLNAYGLKGLEIVRSCNLPLYRRGRLRKINESKYGVKLMDGRCGSCFKCCSEYMHMVAYGFAKKNQGFVDHCWETMCVDVGYDKDPINHPKCTRVQVMEDRFHHSVHKMLPQ